MTSVKHSTENQLHICCNIVLLPGIQKDSRILEVSTVPYRRGHGRQAQKVRSPKAFRYSLTTTQTYNAEV